MTPNSAQSPISKHRKLLAVLALSLAALGTVAHADEKPIELKPGPGKELVEGNCAACHSLDYIVTNSPFLKTGVWEAEIAKMTKVFGAPIDEASQRKILEYLVKNYGG